MDEVNFLTGFKWKRSERSTIMEFYQRLLNFISLKITALVQENQTWVYSKQRCQGWWRALSMASRQSGRQSNSCSFTFSLMPIVRILSLTLLDCPWIDRSHWLCPAKSACCCARRWPYRHGLKSWRDMPPQAHARTAGVDGKLHVAKLSRPPTQCDIAS